MDMESINVDLLFRTADNKCCKIKLKQTNINTNEISPGARKNVTIYKYQYIKKKLKEIQKLFLYCTEYDTVVWK